MKRLIVLFSLVFMSFSGSANAQAQYFTDAAGNLFYYVNQPVIQQAATVVGYDLQSIAYARAAAMAALGWSIDGTSASHNFPNAPGIPAGVNEGIGMSTYSSPPTCMFGGACVADAIVQGANGWFYRVRFFQ